MVKSQCFFLYIYVCLEATQDCFASQQLLRKYVYKYLLCSLLQRWTDTITRSTSTTAGWSFFSARIHLRQRTTNQPSFTGNLIRSAVGLCANLENLIKSKVGYSGTMWFSQAHFQPFIPSVLFFAGVWQRVASLCAECGVPHRVSVCRWHYLRTLPGHRGLPTALLQDWNSTHHRSLLAR